MKNLILWCFFSLSCLALNAQFLLPISQQINTSEGGGTDLGIGYDCLDENNVFHERFLILVTNLHDILGVPEPGMNEPISFPTDYPEMHLRITINDQVEVIPLTTFYRYHDVNGVPSTQPYYGFEYEATYALAECGELIPDGFDVTLNITSELVTTHRVAGQYFPYPVCKFTAHGDIFDCSYFLETEPYCPGSEDYGNCDSYDLSHFSYQSFAECNGKCYRSNPNGTFGLISNNNPTKENTLPNLDHEFFTVVQNPLFQHLEIQWHRKAEKVQVNLYSGNGQLILSEYVTPEKAMNSNWEIGTLPAGIYYLNVQTKEFIKTQKLIKVD